MPWKLFSGSGEPSVPERAWEAIPAPPSWRFQASRKASFEVTDELVEAVNAALHLRRPLLLTGLPGSGKSTLVELIAAELQLGPVLHWHITSKSTLTDALFQYDALGRLHATQVEESLAKTGAAKSGASDVENYITLGPLGTALASPDRPRALLVDEIDKSDLDLPGDLLNVLELGEFDVPPLVRDARMLTLDRRRHDGMPYEVRGVDRKMYTVVNGIVRTTHFPVIIFTSNGERTFPPPFLRRCIRFQMPTPNSTMLQRIVKAHLGSVPDTERHTIENFANRLREGDVLAIDQLLNLLYLVTGESAPNSAKRRELEELILAELNVQ
jgi:MoxR-like ATPase